MRKVRYIPDFFLLALWGYLWTIASSRKKGYFAGSFILQHRWFRMFQERQLYTALLFYQGEQTFFSILFQKFGFPGQSVLSQHLPQLPEGRFRIFQKTAIPVSYTHLDVYKRQNTLFFPLNVNDTFWLFHLNAAFRNRFWYGLFQKYICTRVCRNLDLQVYRMMSISLPAASDFTLCRPVDLSLIHIYPPRIAALLDKVISISAVFFNCLKLFDATLP